VDISEKFIDRGLKGRVRVVVKKRFRWAIKDLRAQVVKPGARKS